uniref:NADH-ubiquinone oxidoreductase chain 2 n=2 Tax=Sternaspis TaxID=36132 RepID=A0A9E8G5L1_9ANNE|nr:NADH dehydrogenase subunit 2 [Sternaspis chinensis]YP_010580943.1 NADH dehydrogenase subunit 2 [Sternaspis liui]UZT27141.1 NADH dehydrogenase subunit 2 [Sternaspis chinensis]UZT27154.1 NADH dehydrogenase subunit 2 [Sternaspis liui]
MMSYLPHSLLFSSSLFMSTLIALSSNHWLMMWLSMELNLLAFLPLMTLSSQKQETESMIKYFLAQATGSILFLFSALFLLPSLFSDNLNFPMMTLTLGLLFKLGVVPCHFWFPNVMASSSWTICMLLATWQKIIPLWIIMSHALPTTSFLLLLSGTSSALLGGLGGLNQTQIQPLLAYSSINHTGWILTSSSLSSSSAIFYFFIYSIILIPMMNSFKTLSFNFYKLQSSMPLTSKLPSQSVILLLSLAGLPPLLGFIPKLIIILLMMSKSLFIPCLVLISGSLISLFFYLNLLFNILINNKKFFIKASPTPINLPINLSIISLSLLLPSPMILL